SHIGAAPALLVPRRNSDSGSRLRAVRGDPFVDLGDGAVDDRVLHAELPADQLYQPVGPLDVRRAGVQGPGGRGPSHRIVGGAGVFLERLQVVWRGAELFADAHYPVVDRPRRFDIAMHRVLDVDGAVLGHAAIVAGQQHCPFG